MKITKKLKSKSGFTLTECVIAIAVFSILAALVTSLMSAALTTHRQNLAETRSLREQRRALVLRHGEYIDVGGTEHNVGAGRTQGRTNTPNQEVAFNFWCIDTCPATCTIPGHRVTYNLAAMIAADAQLAADARGGRLQLTAWDYNSTGTRRRESRFPAIEVSFTNHSGQIPGHLTFRVGAPAPSSSGFPSVINFSGVPLETTEVDPATLRPVLIRSAMQVTVPASLGGAPERVVWAPGHSRTGLNEEGNPDGTINVSDATLLPNIFANFMEIRVDGPASPVEYTKSVTINLALSQARPILGVMATTNEGFDLGAPPSWITVANGTVNGNQVLQITLTRPQSRNNTYFSSFRFVILTQCGGGSNAGPIPDITTWLNLRDLCVCGRPLPNPACGPSCTAPAPPPTP